MGLFDLFKKKESKPIMPVEDLILKTEAEIKHDNETSEVAPKLVSDEEAFFKNDKLPEKKVEPYKARK